ncbi:MAG: thiamine phosphate synthase [Clostridiales bacterium]|nr:thiamine phosphate synthase [Clostridiales bacterium]
MLFFITNRNACGELKLLLKTREAALAGVDYILLRENDLGDDEYRKLAVSMLQMLTQTKTELVICHRDVIADELGLKKHNRFHERTSASFTVSTHSEMEVYSLNDQLIFYGPVFETTCKEGVKAKGIDHIKSSNVIALGGITIEKSEKLKVNHVAVMSEWLSSNTVYDLVKAYKKYGY